MTSETKTFTITTEPSVMRRIERFLALLHFNSGFGHSGVFGMALDGDGAEKVKVDPIDKRLAHEVNLIGGVGYHIEIARDDSYSGYQLDRQRKSYWYTGPAANLYVDGEVRKTVPSRDHNGEKSTQVQMGVRKPRSTEKIDAKVGVPPQAGAVDADFEEPTPLD